MILSLKLQFTIKFIADQLIQKIAISNIIVVSDKTVKIDLFSLSHDYWYSFFWFELAEMNSKILYLELCHTYHMCCIGKCTNRQSDGNIQKTCTDVHLFL